MSHLLEKDKESAFSNKETRKERGKGRGRMMTWRKQEKLTNNIYSVEEMVDNRLIAANAVHLCIEPKTIVLYLETSWKKHFGNGGAKVPSLIYTRWKSIMHNFRTY